jgi:hypothetical protein
VIIRYEKSINPEATFDNDWFLVAFVTKSNFNITDGRAIARDTIKIPIKKKRAPPSIPDEISEIKVIYKKVNMKTVIDAWLCCFDIALPLSVPK